MGRRKKRGHRDVALIQRIENAPAPRSAPWLKVPSLAKDGKLRLMKGDAVSEWAWLVFKPKWGRLPDQQELRSAITSGTVGRYIENRHKSVIVKREIVVQSTTGPDRVIDKPVFRAKVEPKRSDSFQRELNASRAKTRMARHKREAEQEALSMVMDGTISAAELQSTFDSLYAAKERNAKARG